jgi:FAD/FMN-containing dehydrogenase
MAINKISQYLNEHILGEINCAESIRQKFSRDGSVLSITPELVISPRTTNDMRKVARFTWQLAEKNHVLPITVRGGGTDQTGAAIGDGIILNTTAHLNNILYLNMKGKTPFVHVQPGTNFNTLNRVVESHGMTVPVCPTSAAFSTVGGAIANNAGGPLSGVYGLIGDWVDRLEVVLANGDLIETKRINSHELSRKCGLQTFEGEIYRKIDSIIEDNQEVINNELIASSANGNLGYPGIAKVKNHDGSFDLTPLIIGSQGTLGLISEIILNLNYYSDTTSTIVATFTSIESAQTAAQALAQLKPVCLDLLDGRLFDRAQKLYGKKFIFSSTGVDDVQEIGAVLYISFNDFSDGAQRRKIKHALKQLAKFETNIFANSDYSNEELEAVHEVSALLLQPDSKYDSYPPLVDGAFIPEDKRAEFLIGLETLSAKQHLDMLFSMRWLDGIVYARPLLQLHQISDRQKSFKLISDYAELVLSCSGSLVAESGEGRLKTNAAYDKVNDQVIGIYQQIRAAFDPYGTLNPGVKQPSEIKALASCLNPDYSMADFAQYSPKI